MAVYVDPGADDSIRVTFTLAVADTGCDCHIGYAVSDERTGTPQASGGLHFSKNVAVTPPIRYSRLLGVAEVDLWMNGGGSRLVYLAPDHDDVVSFNDVEAAMTGYGGVLRFYVPQGATYMRLKLPTGRGTYGLYDGHGNPRGSGPTTADSLLETIVPGTTDGQYWSLQLQMTTPDTVSGQHGLELRFQFGAGSLAWFTPRFGLSYGQPPGELTPPAELYESQAVLGSDGIPYYFPRLQDPSTSPYPYGQSPDWPATQVLWTGPQSFTFYRSPGGPADVYLTWYADRCNAIQAESWTTDPKARALTQLWGGERTAIPWLGSNILHVRVPNGETRFGVSTDAAGAVCGPALAFSWAGEDKDSPRYTPWSYFYVPDDVGMFDMTLQVTSMARDSVYSYRQFLPAELIVKSPTGVMDSIATSPQENPITRGFGLDDDRRGLWSFRVRAPEKLDPNHPPEVQVVLGYGLAPYATWLDDPERFFAPVIAPGWKRMGRNAATEHWGIGVPVAPYVCTAQLRGDESIENPPTGSQQSKTDYGGGSTLKFVGADSLGLWGTIQGQTWTRRPFVGQPTTFYTMATPSYLNSNGQYLDPGTSQPRHLLELTTGSSHCGGGWWYDWNTCKTTLDSSAIAGWPVTYAQQHTRHSPHLSHTATHVMSRAKTDGILVSARLDAPDDTVGNVPEYSLIDLDMDSLTTNDPGDLWSLEGSDWILNASGGGRSEGGFDHESMAEAAFHMRQGPNGDTKHPLDLGEGPTDLKTNRALEDIADVRASWLYATGLWQVNCRADTTCTPLCDVVARWDDLESARQPGQGLSLYVEAGFYGVNGYIYVNPDTLAEEALASLMLGANAVRVMSRFAGNDWDPNEDQIWRHRPGLWDAMNLHGNGQDRGWIVKSVLTPVVAWLDGMYPGTGNFGRAGVATAQCPSGSIVYGTGQGWYNQQYGAWIVVCNLEAEQTPAPDEVVLPWSDLHGWEAGDSSAFKDAFTMVRKSNVVVPPTWKVSGDGLTWNLYGATWAVAFVPYTNPASVRGDGTSDLWHLTVMPVPVTGTARAHFYLPVDVSVITEIEGSIPGFGSRKLRVRGLFPSGIMEKTPSRSLI